MDNVGITTEELDFAVEPYSQVMINNTEELMVLFEKSLIDGRTYLVPENEMINSINKYKGERIKKSSRL